VSDPDRPLRNGRFAPLFAGLGGGLGALAGYATPNPGLGALLGMYLDDRLG
jgi:hypothetical protein